MSTFTTLTNLLTRAKNSLRQALTSRPPPPPSQPQPLNPHHQRYWQQEHPYRRCPHCTRHLPINGSRCRTCGYTPPADLDKPLPPLPLKPSPVARVVRRGMRGFEEVGREWFGDGSASPSERVRVQMVRGEKEWEERREMEEVQRRIEWERERERRREEEKEEVRSWWEREVEREMEMGMSREDISRWNSHFPFRSTHSLERICSISPLRLPNSPLPLPTPRSYSESGSDEEEYEYYDEYSEDDDEEPVQFRNPWEAGNPLIDEEEEAWWCVYLNRRADGDLPTRLGQLTEQRSLNEEASPG